MRAAIERAATVALLLCAVIALWGVWRDHEPVAISYDPPDFGPHIRELPRGLRNHNPGNLEASPGNPWLGETECASESRFACFHRPVWGIRAMARTLHNYQTRHGLDTVAEVAQRYVGGDRPEVWSRNVAAASGLDPHEPLNLTDEDTLVQVVKGIIQAETGLMPYTSDTVDIGVRLSIEFD